MPNMLKADFFKLKKSKAFWICTAACLLLGVILVVAMQQAMNRGLATNGPAYESMLEMSSKASGAWIIGEGLGEGLQLMLIGIFTAIFVSSEFIYGTMKNTLSRGADRIKVFLSKFVVCSVAALVMLAAIELACLVTGTIVWGFDPAGLFTLSGLLGMLLPQVLLVIAFVALFECISMTMRSNGGAIAVNIVIVSMFGTVLEALNLFLGGKIDLTDYWIGTSVEKLSTITPASSDIIMGIILAAVWGIASIVVGSVLFKKQDVK